jgi:3-oxoadipate enol-lactonase
MAYFKSTDGTRIHMVIEGPEHAPALVLAHSVGCDLTLWDAQASTLRERYRVIRYDARGHGRSEATRGDYEVEQLASDAIAILGELEIAAVHWCGLSLGGTVGQWLAIHQPDLLLSLTLADTAARLGTVDGWQSRIDAVRASGTRAIADASMTRFFSDRFRAADRATVDRFRAILSQTSDDGFAGCCAVLRDCDFRAQLSRIHAATLVICGDSDIPTPPQDSEDLANGIAGAELVFLPGVGHLSAVEAPEAFTAALAAHLERVQSRWTVGA